MSDLGNLVGGVVNTALKLSPIGIIGSIIDSCKPKHTKFKDDLMDVLKQMGYPEDQCKRIRENLDDGNDNGLKEGDKGLDRKMRMLIDGAGSPEAAATLTQAIQALCQKHDIPSESINCDTLSQESPHYYSPPSRNWFYDAQAEEEA